jgi:hypothetical protein
MATYDEIYGKRVEVLDADPTLNSTYEGQVWYNSATGKLRTVVAFKAYSTSTSLPSARGTNAPGGSAQDAGFSVGGNTPPSIANTDEYNGLGWTAGGAYPAGKGYLASAGPETAALAGGGSAYPSACNTYNGTTWTGITAMPTGYEACRYAGTSTAGIMTAGGDGGSPGYPANTHEWGGSSWTAGGSLPSTKNYGSTVSGTQTASFSAGGSYPQKNTTSNYDGTSWTVSGNLPTNSYNMMGNSVGSQTAGVTTGGNATSFPAIAPTVYHYDGSVWAADIASPLGYTNTGSSFGPQSAHVFAGGNAPGLVSTVQEYNVSINTVTAAAWASGTALGTGRESMSSAGTQTAALAVGGRVGPPGGTTAVEDYDGSSWESAPVLNTARQYAGGCGTQTAAITYGGGPPEITTTEEFNGSSWSTQPNSMSTARRAFASFGIQTAAVAAGGQTGTAVTAATEEYNGTSWSTSPGSLAQARQYFAGAGIESSGLAFGGSDHPNSTKYTNTEEYGGTSWTTGGVLPTGTSGLMGCGATNTAALAFGGYQPSKVATTVGYDGTAWSSRPSMGGATAEGSGAGTSIAALSIGGSPAETGVEEFTGEVETVTASTLTTG